MNTTTATLIVLFAFFSLTFAQIEFENSINLNTNFPRKGAKECNIYDEATYCQQTVIDQRLSLVAVSHKCACPSGYRCPNDVADTDAFTHCEWDEERHWNRCRMRCVPVF